MARFTDLMVPERVQPFWAALQRGEFITDAAAEVGTYRKRGTRWVAAAGGVRPRREHYGCEGVDRGLDAESGTGRDHRRLAGVDGGDDLGVVDPLQIVE